MRILLLCHLDFKPPKGTRTPYIVENALWRTEYYVREALLGLGHEVEVCCISHELNPLRDQLKRWKPDIIFNLVEEFAGEGLLEPLVVSYLESTMVPFTGNSSLPLILSKNKIAAKKIMQSVRLPTPGNKKFPKIVKLIDEESSRGVAEQSIVCNSQQERRQHARLNKVFSCGTFSEEYIEGREIHVAVMKAKAKWIIAPIWETRFGQHAGHPILSEKIKWDFAYRDKVGVRLEQAQGIPTPLSQRIQKIAIQSCKCLAIDGYARVDMRVTRDNKIYVLEVNPNPDVARGDEFAECMKSAGYDYAQLIAQILEQGLTRRQKGARL